MISTPSELTPTCYNNIEADPIPETTMDLPVKFPSETEVILEDVARFRALSPEERIRSFRGLLRSAAMIGRKSPKADWARQYAEEQEILAQKNIREFLARNGY
jgi:hypothetical protein